TLKKPARKIAGFRQEEQADLRDVRSGRDVYQVILLVGIKWGCAREIGEFFVNLFEVPGVVELDDMKANFGFGGDCVNVLAHDVCQTRLSLRMNQFETFHNKAGWR